MGFLISEIDWTIMYFFQMLFGKEEGRRILFIKISSLGIVLFIILDEFVFKEIVTLPSFGFCIFLVLVGILTKEYLILIEWFRGILDSSLFMVIVRTIMSFLIFLNLLSLIGESEIDLANLFFYIFVWMFTYLASERWNWEKPNPYSS